MTPKQTAYRWMQNHAHEYVDECAEINTTYLAEAACQEFDAYGPPPTYDAPEEYFDWVGNYGKWYTLGTDGGYYEINAPIWWCYIPEPPSLF